MENSSTTNYRNAVENRNRNNFHKSYPLNEIDKSNPVYEKLAEENCEYYFEYLEYLGLSTDKDLVLIPSSHHYYYDAEDLKNVKTLINLKQLNYIKQIREFLETIQNILPDKSIFIGSFVEGKNSFGFFSGPNKHKYQISGKFDPVENGISSRIPLFNMIYDIMDSRTNRYLTKKTVKVMLDEAGLKVSDMTEFNGLTFFCTTKNPRVQ